MHSLRIISSPTYVEPLFKACSPSLTAIQRKVVNVALIIFSCLATCYVCYQIYFKANEQRIKPLNQEEVISNSQVTEIPVQEEEKEDQLHDVDGELKIYPLLLSNKDELNHWADITFKNVSRLEDARIILIGESHGTPEHIEIEHYIAYNFGRDDDILLKEGAEGKLKRYFDHMDTYGWENIKFFNESMGIMKKLFDIRNKLLANANSPELNEIINLGKQYVFSFNKRNEALIHNLTNLILKFPDKKFILIAGKSHLLGKGSKTYNILDYLPKEEKCVLLILKDPKNHAMNKESYLEKLEKDVNQLEDDS